MADIVFTCPKCGSHRIEEIMVDMTVASEISISEDEADGGIFHRYGEQTNDGGHVDRYQCEDCGYVILDDSPENEDKTQDGLDERALANEIKRINADDDCPDAIPHRLPAREILRDISAEQGWTPETEICVLCDYIDLITAPVEKGICVWVEYLKERSESEEEEVNR